MNRRSVLEFLGGLFGAMGGVWAAVEIHALLVRHSVYEAVATVESFEDDLAAQDRRIVALEAENRILIQKINAAEDAVLRDSPVSPSTAR